MKIDLINLVNSIQDKLNDLKVKIDSLPNDQNFMNLKNENVSIVQQTIVQQTIQQQAIDVQKQLEDFISNPQWVAAVPPDLMCDENNNEDKMERARGIRDIFYPNYSFENKRILDFGAGYGHLVKAVSENNPAIVVGYDIKNDFQIDSNDKMKFTTSWDDVLKNGPYDLIYIYDVIDHIVDDRPEQFLSKVRLLLSDNGVARMRCHPFIGRHGGHAYTKVNKSYAHLALTKEELIALGCDLKNYPTLKVLTPIMTYNKFIVSSGLKIIDQKTISEPAEKFFLEGDVGNKIKVNLNIKNLLIPQMSIQFCDYTLTK
jgi:2-polyprenyl-3-methyl-5-hydroxy-6-metoxy-1,4-benzoquinol methylase